MTLRMHWFLPTTGDSRYVVGGGHGSAPGIAAGDRPASIAYLGQIARTAEQLGFEGALTPTGAWCEDAWVVTAMLTQLTERLKFLVAFRPGLVSPALAAQMATTYQRQSQGRLLLNVVTGGDANEQRAYGDYLDKDERYERTGEFLDIVSRLWSGQTVSHHGTHLDVDEARLNRLPEPAPEIYFGGSSAAAGSVAARHVDVYLTWGEPPSAVAEKVNWVRALAAEQNRSVRFGIRLHVITRDRAEHAWQEAHRLLDGMDPDRVRAAQLGQSSIESEGQRRMRALHRGGTADLEVSPNLWAGIGLVRGGAGTALVGSHSEVADRIREYHEIGIDEFILSGIPHLEEAYWFGEGVLPLLARRGLWTHPAGEQPVEDGIAAFAPGTPAATS